MSVEGVEPTVGIVMTERAFEKAQTAGIRGITPRIGSMEAVAHKVGFTDEQGRLPSMLIALRDGVSDHSLEEQRWDVKLPVNERSPSPGLFVDAAELNRRYGAHSTLTWEGIVEQAREINARALTEVSIGLRGWDVVGRRHDPEALAEGMLLGQRPLTLEQPKPTRVVNWTRKMRGLAVRDNVLCTVRSAMMNSPFGVVYDA